MPAMAASCRLWVDRNPGKLQMGPFPIEGPFLLLAQVATGGGCIFLLLLSLPHHVSFSLCGHLLSEDKFSLCSPAWIVIDQ